MKSVQAHAHAAHEQQHGLTLKLRKSNFIQEKTSSRSDYI